MTFEDIYDSLFFSGRLLGISFVSAAAMILFRDIGWYFLDIPTRDQTKATKNCYDWFEHYLPVIKGERIDYSEGLFDFTKPMTLQEATLNKYNYIFNKLGLKPGMTLLDAGCGSGVWMEYCRDRGVNTIGLTLSPEQAKVVQAKGLEVYVRDYRKEDPSFLGKFDRITALGSTEHVCSSKGIFANNAARARSSETLTDIWGLFKRYLKPEGKIYITALTLNDKHKFTLNDHLQSYILDQHYGGYYATLNDIQTKVAPNAGLTISDIQDQTASYHWSSMVEPKHFGYFKINWSENTWDKVSYIFTSLLKSPLQFPFHWLYQGLDSWIWQFGGPSKTPLTKEQVDKVPMQLKYFMLTPSPATTQQQDNAIPRRLTPF